MDVSLASWLVIAVALAFANLPFLNESVLGFIPVKPALNKAHAKYFVVRLLELVVLYFVVGALAHWPIWASISRLGSLALFAVIVARIVRGGPPRILALVTLASILAALFGGELLDPIGVPGIWFPFNIGVSRTQYIYAIGVPLLAVLTVRTLRRRSGQR